MICEAQGETPAGVESGNVSINLQKQLWKLRKMQVRRLMKFTREWAKLANGIYSLRAPLSSKLLLFDKSIAISSPLVTFLHKTLPVLIRQMPLHKSSLASQPV